MKPRLSLMVLVLLAAALPAVAQVPAFDAEIDCDGIFAGGDSVPFLLDFQNQTLEQQNLEMTLAINIPGIGDRTLIQRNLTLGPNQDRLISRQFNLPVSAPNGNYTMSLTATNGVEMTFDTCSFNVVN